MSDDDNTQDELPTPGTAPAPAPVAEPVKAPKSTGSGRYAIYNETLGQYVGGVVDGKKPTAAQAKSAVPDGHEATVREV